MNRDENTNNKNGAGLPPLLLVGEDGCLRGQAEHLAAELGVELLTDPGDAELYLRLDGQGLSLSDGGQTVSGDFCRLLPRLRPANLNGELLVRAARGKDRADEGENLPLAVDATAGLGEDSFLLAAAGFRVLLFERDPVIAALLSDALRRARENPGIAAIAARMTLCAGDSIGALQALPETPDVVYLDPMFPERQKSGLVKKKFQLLHHLEAPCDEETALLAAARAAAPRKIVIKRPLKAPPLAGTRPSYALTGKAIRYDCLVLR